MQRSLFSFHPFFCFYINDLYIKNIIKSLVSNYAEDTTVYGCTSRNLDEQIMEPDLSYDPDPTDQWAKTDLCHSIPPKVN